MREELYVRKIDRLEEENAELRRTARLSWSRGRYAGAVVNLAVINAGTLIINAGNGSAFDCVKFVGAWSVGMILAYVYERYRKSV